MKASLKVMYLQNIAFNLLKSVNEVLLQCDMVLIAHVYNKTGLLSS